MKTPLALPRPLALAIALLTAALPSLAQDAPGGNVQAARAKVAMCIGCHGIPGYQASFPEVHKVPMISGQNAKYIAAALTAYRQGERKHPSMRGIAQSLSDQDIADLAAFYETSGKDLPAAPPKASPEANETIQSLLTRGACLSCHGEGLNKPIDASYPKLAGQHADYLYVALRAYQVKRNPQIGRNNVIMAKQVEAYTSAELKALAKHIAALPGDLKTVPQAKFKD